MKTKILVVLMVIGVLALGVIGCSQEATTAQPSTMPPLKPGVQGRLIEISYDDLQAQKNISQEIELTFPQSLVVSLASNPSTGFQWTENAAISDPTVISQYEHNVVAAQNNMPGAAGKEVWTFKPLKTGTSTVSLSYSQPWQGGTQNEWTFTLKITIK